MKKLYSPILFLALILVESCTEPISIKLDSTKVKLVVEGYFSDDTLAHPVKLSRTADYFANKPLEPISGAIVSITDGIDTFPLAESPDSLGLYQTSGNVYGIPGHTYTLHIEGVDIDNNGVAESYTASSKLNRMAPPDSIEILHKDLFYQDVWQVNFYAQEPGDTRDYYLFRTWKNGKLVKDTLFEVNLSDDEIINGVYSDGLTVQYLFKQKPDEIVQVGDTIMLEIQAITKEYFQFIIDVLTESRGSDPFGGQPANVSTNISDGGMGFFTAYAVKRLSRVYKGE